MTTKTNKILIAFMVPEGFIGNLLASCLCLSVCRSARRFNYEVIDRFSLNLARTSCHWRVSIFAVFTHCHQKYQYGGRANA